MTLDDAFTRQFAQEWVAAWNSRDIEAILAHYADDIIFHSPRIRIVMGADIATVRGKSELRNYWARAIAAAPALRFTLRARLASSDAVTLLYDNHRQERVAETFIFNASGLVQESVAAYAREDSPAP